MPVTELEFKVVANTQKLADVNKRLDQMDKTLNKATKSTNKLDDATDGLTKSVIKLTAAYVSFEAAKSAIIIAADFEEALAGVRKTTGLAGDELERLEASLENLGSTLKGVKQEELFGIAQTAGQLGIKGVQDISAFTETVAKIGIATDLTAEEAAGAFAQLSNSLNVPIAGLENLASIFNEVSNNSTATVRDLVNFTQRIAGAGKTADLTNAEIVALAATLKDTGSNFEVGGTAISKTLSLIIKDTEKFADASGVEFNTYAQMLESKPIKAVEAFLKSLAKLDKRARLEALDKVGLTGTEASSVLLKLSGNVAKLEENLKTANEEMGRGTSLTKEYAAASDTFNASFDRLSNQVTQVGEEIGSIFLPIGTVMVDVLSVGLEGIDVGLEQWKLRFQKFVEVDIQQLFKGTQLAFAQSAQGYFGPGTALGDLFDLLDGVKGNAGFTKTIRELQGELVKLEDKENRLTLKYIENEEKFNEFAKAVLTGTESAKKATEDLNKAIEDTGKAIGGATKQVETGIAGWKKYQDDLAGFDGPDSFISFFDAMQEEMKRIGYEAEPPWESDPDRWKIKEVDDIFGDTFADSLANNVSYGIEEGIRTGDYSQLGENIARQVAVAGGQQLGGMLPGVLGTVGAGVLGGVAGGLVGQLFGGGDKKPRISLDELADRKFQDLINAIEDNTSILELTKPGTAGAQRQAELEAEASRRAGALGVLGLGGDASVQQITDALFAIRNGAFFLSENFTFDEDAQAAVAALKEFGFELTKSASDTRNIAAEISNLSDIQEEIVKTEIEAQKELASYTAITAEQAKAFVAKEGGNLVTFLEDLEKAGERANNIILGLTDESLSKMDETVLRISEDSPGAVAALRELADTVDPIPDMINSVTGSFDGMINSIDNITRSQQGFIDKNTMFVQSNAESIATLQARLKTEDEQAGAARKAVELAGDNPAAELLARLAQEEQDVLRVGELLTGKAREVFASSAEGTSIINDVLATVNENQKNALTLQEQLQTRQTQLLEAIELGIKKINEDGIIVSIDNAEEVGNEVARAAS